MDMTSPELQDSHTTEPELVELSALFQRCGQTALEPNIEATNQVVDCIRALRGKIVQATFPSGERLISPNWGLASPRNQASGSIQTALYYPGEQKPRNRLFYPWLGIKPQQRFPHDALYRVPIVSAGGEVVVRLEFLP